MPERSAVLFGASGFTGRLVAQAAVRQGLDLVLAGRDRDRLEAVAAELPGAPRVQVVDARDPVALDALAGEAPVLLSTVGPFGRLGDPVVAACLARGTHYLDTTGEQPWTARVHDSWDAPARSAGVVLCPSLAFEVAVADVAAGLAAAPLDRLHRVEVIYATQGFGTSRGTRASALEVVAEGGFERHRGERRPLAPGARAVAVDLPGLGRRAAVAFPSGEAVTMPRHLPIPSVATWAVVPGPVARVAPVAGPILQGLLMGAPGHRLARALQRWGGVPSARGRGRARAWVAVTAHGETAGVPGAYTVVAEVTDPYGLTAELLVAGARRVLAGEVAPGARTPAEVVGPGEAFFESLGVAWHRFEGDVGV